MPNAAVRWRNSRPAAQKWLASDPDFLSRPVRAAVVCLAFSEIMRDAAHSSSDSDGILTGPLRAQLRGRDGALTVWFWRDHSEPSDAAADAMT